MFFHDVIKAYRYLCKNMNLQIFEEGNIFSLQSNLKWFHWVETYIEILSDDVSDDIGNIMASFFLYLYNPCFLDFF